MEKYLRHYAEPENSVLDELTSFFESGYWDHVLVIPACNESADFLRPPPPCAGRSLLVLVINEPFTASEAVSSNNRALAKEVMTRFDLQWEQDFSKFAMSLFEDAQAARDVLLVDRFSDGHQLPEKGGVGQARKIGADLAAGLIHRERIHSRWIHCSDADVRLPETYFSCTGKLPESGDKIAALNYPFHHDRKHGKAGNRAVASATQLYEFSLRYYVAGLRFARSPYAFHTIGSTMAVSADHYAKVRGFPRRAAGEDFYLLNKLAKVGSVHELEPGPNCEALKIESRRSDRVPFGTGAAVNKITALADPLGEFRFYHPAVFVLLQQWLQALSGIWQSDSDTLSSMIKPVWPDKLQTGSPNPLLECLEKIGTEKALDHAFKQSKNHLQFQRHMHIWFDAFRTLKLIHELRDHRLPSIAYTELEDDQTFRQLLEQDQELAACFNSWCSNPESS